MKKPHSVSNWAGYNFILQIKAFYVHCSDKMFCLRRITATKKYNDNFNNI